MKSYDKEIAALRKIFSTPKIDQKLVEETNHLKTSFHAFVKAAWHIIEGSNPFIDNWHIQAMCEHLEALHRLEIRKLIINVPPRSAKSTIATIMWPVWTWIHDPAIRYFCLSHSDDLATKHSVDSRNIISSDWFIERWGDLFTIKQDQNNKHLYVNNKGGFRESCGIFSKITGKGGGRIIVDDLNDAEEFQSVTVKVNEKYSGALSTRENNPNTSTWLDIQQRTRENDITGYILANESDWVHLYLPMEFETSRRCITVPLLSTAGNQWQDPRTEEGELLWPDFFKQEKVEKRKKQLGSYRYAGQYQQRPAPEQGGILKKSYFRWWKSAKVPELEHVIQSWDTALEGGELNNYSACTTWGIFRDEHYIRNVILLRAWRGKVEYPTLRRYAQRLYNDYRDNLQGDYELMPNNRFVPDVVLVEAKVSGIPLVHDLRDAGIDAVRFNPNKYGDKTDRVKLISHLFENGRIWVPAQPPHYDRLLPFADEFVEACALFPNGDSKDYVDSMSQAIIRLWKSRLIKNTGDKDFDSWEE